MKKNAIAILSVQYLTPHPLSVHWTLTVRKSYFDSPLSVIKEMNFVVALSCLHVFQDRRMEGRTNEQTHVQIRHPIYKLPPLRKEVKIMVQ